MWLWAPACILHWGRFRADSVAIRANGEDVTYGRFAADIMCAAQGARTVGLPKSRVAVIAQHKYQFLVSLLGLQLAECPVVVLNPGLSVEQLTTAVGDATPSAVVTDFDLRSSPLAPALLSVKRRFRTSDISGDKKCTLDDYLANPAWSQPQLDDDWGVLYSSGSTGAPKAILQSNEAMMTESIAWILELELRRSTSFYVARPLYYTGGLVLTLAMLTVGGTTIVDDYSNINNTDELFAALDSAADVRKLDRCFLVPEQARQLVKANRPWKHKDNPASVFVMGSPITAAEKLALSRYFKCSVVESWGNSEGLGTITDPDDLKKRPKSVGRPFLSEPMFIVDDDARICGPRSIGRLAGSDESMFTEYLNRPEATRFAKRRSLVISDDIGYRDEEGYFYIIGRSQDVVTIGGHTVVLTDIEARLRGLDWISEVCVGVIESDTGMRLLALVELGPTSPGTPSRSASLDVLNQVLGDNEKLSGVLTVGQIPRLSSGKLDHVAAREILRRESGSGQGAGPA